ncbi:MAG TPA: twin-arginine translocase TatA/TatE family subunit [Dehalococcoidia bacterium]|nr:twin-arginine translocase TatA/TatE family subunit [Dehalococcoidia bacterium]
MSFGPVEAIVIVVVVLVVFGAGRLAGVGKALGTGLREFREEAKVPGEENGESEESSAEETAEEEKSS